jgi:hypothetical protein
MDTLAHKPNLDDVLRRLRSLYGREARDRIFAAVEVPTAALEQFGREYSDGFCDYPDPSARIDFWDRLLGERAAVEDDSVPSVYLTEMDQGLYGGLVGGDVQFMAHSENGWISSMVAPLLDDWSEFDSLRFSPSHPWFERYVAQLDTFVRRAADRFAVSHFILIDGLNFAFELVGATKTYLSLDECPEMIRRVIEFAFELNLAVQTTFFDQAGTLAGGTASNMAQWVPGRIVSESVDPFHMTSVDYFETWGREPVERILGRFDGGVLHIHGNGRHLLEAVSTVEGLKAIFLGDDKGFPQAFDVLDELQARTADVPLVVQVDIDRFVEKLDERRLPGGVFYKVSGAGDADTANRLMEKVRGYRT